MLPTPDYESIIVYISASTAMTRWNSQPPEAWATVMPASAKNATFLREA